MPIDHGIRADYSTGAVSPFAGVPITQTESAAAVARSEDLHRLSRDLHPRTARLRRDAYLRRWEEMQRANVARDGKALLEELGDLGMAWRDVARSVGVSVPAVQKWRRDGGITGANRLRLAGIVALVHWLKESMIDEPVSWLEVPVRTGVDVCGLDLLADNRIDLVMELAGDEYTSVETPVAVLDEYDADWRMTRVDEHFEVFIASDGVPSIRPKG